MHVVTIVLCAVALSTQVRLPNAYSDLPVGPNTPPTTSEQQGPLATSKETLPTPTNAGDMPAGDPTTTSDWLSRQTDFTAAEPILETLEQAWSIATANHPLMQARQHEVAAADYQLRRSRAEFRPSWSFESGYTVRDGEPGFRLQNPALPLTSNVFPIAQDEALLFRTFVALPLYTSGQIRHGVAAAEANRGIADNQLATTVMDLKLQVAAAYTSVMRAQRNADVARCRETSLQAHLREVSSLRDHQQVCQNDLMAASVAYSNALYQEVQAANRLDVARAEYNRLLGRSLNYPVQLAELQPPQLEGNLDDLTHRALTQRLELTTLALHSKALFEQAGAARAASKPHVELLGEYAFEENRFVDPEGIASLTMTVHWNVMDGGRSRYYADSLVQESASVAMVRADLESTIQLEVRKAWLDFQEALRRIGISGQALLQAEENLRVPKQNYAAGFATNTEVLNAATYRAEMQRDYHQAIYDAVLAELRIRRAVGEL